MLRSRSRRTGAGADRRVGHRRITAVAASLVLITGLAACGDDDVPASTTLASTTLASTTLASTTLAPTTPGTAVVSTGSSATAGPAAATGVAVSGAWVRAAAPTSTYGAAYMTLTAQAADELVGIAVDPAVARTAELHETTVAGTPGMGTMAGGSHGTGTGMGTMAGGTHGTGMGTMTMQQVHSIVLPAGTAVALEPGGYHVMLIDLAEPLVAGDTVKVTLTFKIAGTLEVDVPVREDAP